MSWIYFVFLATFIWAVTNIMDKYIIEKRIKSPMTVFIFLRAISIIPTLVLFLFLNIGIPKPDFLVLILVSAILMVVGILLYYKIVEIEEISVSIPLFQFIPIFTLFMAFFALGERVVAIDYLGFILLVAGGFIISLKKTSGIFRPGKVFWFAVLASMAFSTSYVIAKYVLSYVDYWEVFTWTLLLGTCVTMPLLLSGRIKGNLKYYYSRIGRTDWAILSTNIIISIIASASYYLAIKAGPLSLVQASENVQMIFVFALVLLFTHFYPAVLKEKFDRRALLQKISGMMLIIIGVLLTQWF